ncbi:hypothetical protein NLJ89_g4132 [Agrocybe chaxingu]|uniref:Wax synthase domain-containing protein n=1 Tax=Agrocybe chaxingu TaxID=84603 RepID=A0A9W8K932_9AGAR|nr:hypothetical protein NLJ89_g4132 [Agrocybe chaxingu]
MTVTRQPFSVALFGLLQAISVVGMVPGIPKLVRGVALMVFGWVSYILITQTTTGDLPIDVAIGSAILTQYMITIDVLLLTQPNVLRNPQDPLSNKVTKRTLRQRITWAFHLYTNPRGIGWSHEHPHLPNRPSLSTPRWTFVRTRIFRAFFCICLERVGYFLNASNPGTTTPGRILSESPFHWRAVGVTGFAAAGFARINMLNCLLSAAIVGLGISSPERWPNLFGSPLDAWSVQRFWRRVWHQLLRKSLVACTSVFTSSITLHNSSRILKKLIRLHVAFMIIGVIHLGGEYMIIDEIIWSGAFKFFTLQAVAITLESVLSHLWSISSRSQKLPKATKDLHPNGNTNGHSGLAKKANPSSIAPQRRLSLALRLLGCTWVSLWFIWSAAFMIDPMVSSGMFVDPQADLRQRIGMFKWPWGS